MHDATVTQIMEKISSYSKSITIKELWDIFVQRLWIIILVAAIGVGAIYAAVQVTFVPRYESVATLYIMREESDSSAAEKVQEYNLAIRVLKDYDYMLKSHTVLDEVRERLENDETPIKTSYGALRGSITITNPTDTRILEVKVESDSPENAKKTVDALCEIGIEKIAAVMDGEGQVTLYEYGLLNTSPCNKTGIMTFALFGVIIALVVYIIFVAAYVLDDRIKSDEEIEEYFSMSVLGDIPDANEHSSKRYRSYYKRYGAYKYYGSKYQAPQTPQVPQTSDTDNNGGEAK